MSKGCLNSWRSSPTTMLPTGTGQNGWPEQPQGGFSNKPLTNHVKLHGGDISPTLYFFNYSGLTELPQHIRRLVFHKAHFRITVTDWLTHNYELRPPRRSWPLGKLTLKYLSLPHFGLATMEINTQQWPNQRQCPSNNNNCNNTNH
jgi:hypothetical protein